MDFRQLESFVAIARLKSFSKAADKLFLTQPTLSNHIARLEEELDVTLFERNNKKTVLTPAGQVFFISAQEILNRREAAVLDLVDFQGKIEGMMEIGASSIPSQYLLPALITVFHQQYPDVVFNLHYMNSLKVIDTILAGELDFGFVGSPPTNPLLVYEKVADDYLVVIAPLCDPFANMKDISVEELLQYELLLRPEGSATRQKFEDLVNTDPKHPAKLRVAAYMDNDEVITLSVIQGLGLAVTSALSVADKVSLGLLKALPFRDKNMERAFYFVYPKGRILSPLVGRFRDFVVKDSWPNNIPRLSFRDED